MNFKKDFLILNKNIIYFDNAATTFKPKSVNLKETEYEENYCSNIHRGEYNISFKADDEYEETRNIVKDFINAEKREEIIFTSGTTEGLNLVINGFFENILKQGDQVILSKSEHASNILPWINLSFKKGIVLKYASLGENGELSVESIKKEINEKTKVISIAEITNVVGDQRDIKQISSIARSKNIYTLIDGAQSVPHKKTDVQDLDIDFLVFSSHKMCGPTGVGILYGKYKLLNKIIPYKLGGGMNESFGNNNVMLKDLPSRLEAGTPNITGVISFKESIKYIQNIGFDYIQNKEKYLKEYLIKKLKEIDYIEIYNKNFESGILIINAKNIASENLAFYLNSKNICVRAGNHCAKMIKEELKFNNTVRISFYFYNELEEIDKLVEALSDKKSLYNF